MGSERQNGSHLEKSGLGAEAVFACVLLERNKNRRESAEERRDDVGQGGKRVGQISRKDSEGRILRRERLSTVFL